MVRPDMIRALLVQQQPVQRRPHPRGRPFVQTVPQRHAATAPSPCAQFLQRMPVLEHQEDAAEAHAIGVRRLPPLGLGGCRDRIGSTKAYNSSVTNNLPLASPVKRTQKS
jgi:hypothetical protein